MIKNRRAVTRLFILLSVFFLAAAGAGLYFGGRYISDIVRLVEPKHTLSLGEEAEEKCGPHACYAVWGKASRCRSCTSLKALENKNRQCKLERSRTGLYFVISEYVPFADTGAVIEMVIRLDDAEAGRAEEAGGRLR